MSATILVQTLKRERDELAVRWLRRFMVNRAIAGQPTIHLNRDLVGAFAVEIIDLLCASRTRQIPRRHHACVFARLAEFPASVALCIDFFQAGSQVIGAYIVEHAGPSAAWSLSARNRFLGEVDAVFHILVHREIEALCEMRLQRASGHPAGAEGHPRLAAGLEGVPDAMLLRN